MNAMRYVCRSRPNGNTAAATGRSRVLEPTCALVLSRDRRSSGDASACCDDGADSGEQHGERNDGSDVSGGRAGGGQAWRGDRDRLGEADATAGGVHGQSVCAAAQVVRQCTRDGHDTLSIGIPRTDHLGCGRHDQLDELEGCEATEGDGDGFADDDRALGDDG